MEQAFNISKQENIELPEELDTEKIKHLFVELPSDKVELLANHLMRPDGFAKTLITGSIRCSEELQDRIAFDFAKPHRSYYQGNFKRFYDTNDYVSFGVGKAQQLYHRGNSEKSAEKEKENGIGFTMPAKKLLSQNSVAPSWLCIGLPSLVEKHSERVVSDPRMEKYLSLSWNELSDIDMRPKKENFLELVDIARKADLLDGRDQAEINMYKQTGEYPHLALDETIILIPKIQRKTIEIYLKKKIKELQKNVEEIKQLFGVDVSTISVDSVLSRKNIYWYPQENIEIAVEYLTTHPEKIYEFLPQEKHI